jgi:uncharacterized protein (TIGR02001 family)
MGMKSALSCLICIGLAGMPSAWAEQIEGEPSMPQTHELNMNVGLATQYVYRGLSQTNGYPAVQGGIDYEYRETWYAGAWFSNTSIYNDVMRGASSSLEIDTYTGFEGRIAKAWAYDVGLIHYAFPGRYPQSSLKAARLVRPDSTEAYASLAYRGLTLKYSHALGTLFGIPNSSGTYYLEADGDFPVSGTGINLALHAGRQVFRGVSGTGIANNRLYSYSDYRIGISEKFSKYIVSIATTTSSANASVYTNLFGNNIGKTHVVASVYTEF